MFSYSFFSSIFWQITNPKMSSLPYHCSLHTTLGQISFFDRTVTTYSNGRAHRGISSHYFPNKHRSERSHLTFPLTFPFGLNALHAGSSSHYPLQNKNSPFLLLLFVHFRSPNKKTQITTARELPAWLFTSLHWN